MKGQRTAVVTGGAEGIGACISETLCSHGYEVLLCDIDAEKGVEREKILKDKGLNAIFVHADVSNYEDMKVLSEWVKEKFGKLDLIVNNAGIADPEMKFPSGNVNSWNKVIGTNLSGAYYTVNFLVDLMPPGSCIINIASTRAFQSEPNTLAYSASKGGIVALTHSLALTLSKRKIRANCISPGWIDTSLWKLPPVEPDLTRIDHEQHPSRRVGRPEDVAGLVSFLAGESSNWINGENIVLDGGMTKRMIYLDDSTVKEIKGI